ncbi:MAG: acyl-CoA dehydrogenase family protein, partial [Bosea sp. (in: a-proteobacteria)]|nr:acyl-CoA dehydrogenase family protein [Bosea sp. (in: a-proteobacteria)]
MSAQAAVHVADAAPASATALIAAALPGFETLLQNAVAAVRASVTVEGKISSARLEAQQHAAHGLAWLATYVMALRELKAYGERLATEDRYGAIEDYAIRIGAGEYAAQILGGIPMSQGEIVRLAALGLSEKAIADADTPATRALIAQGNTPENRARLVDLFSQDDGAAGVGDPGLDETLEAIRSEMRRFCAAEVKPHAHEWHLKNDYIPMEVVEKMAELGVFGLTIPEEFGGMGLTKVSMCVVSEELSRAYIGVGSLGTRSEIAAELILCGGTAEQKEKWLPKLASGEVLPTAVFTEPNTGSDLASLRTRAVKEGEGDKAVWKVSGNKTWITHPVRADIMTLLVRTDPSESGYKGLSMLIAEKPRGTDEDPFPVAGLTGGEIEVLGYRGMKE